MMFRDYLRSYGYAMILFVEQKKENYRRIQITGLQKNLFNFRLNRLFYLNKRLWLFTVQPCFLS